MQPQSFTARSKPVLPVPPSADRFNIVASHCDLVATEFGYKKDEEIYGEDEPADYAYQVVRGAVRCYKLLSDGRRQVGAFHLPGDVFGIETGPKHRLSAEAIIDTAVRLVRRSSLEAVAATNAKVAHQLWTMTVADLKHAEDHMLLLGRKTAMERVVAFLLEMDKRLSSAGILGLPMSRRDIGDYLGLTLETVSRALSQLNEEGALTFSGARRISLSNRHRLAAMADVTI